MVYVISKSIMADFSNGVNAERLHKEVELSSISSAVIEAVNVDEGADSCDAVFDVEPSAPDKTTYDGIVAAHSGLPVNEIFGGLGRGGAGAGSIVFDHFVTGNTDLDEIGIMGWRSDSTGTGSNLDVVSEPGHPGIVRISAGTSVSAYSAIHLGDSTRGHTYKTGGLFRTYMNTLIKLDGSISATSLERFVIGFIGTPDAAGEPNDGVYIQYEPSTSSAFQLVGAAAATRTKAAGTTVVSIGTWYRVGFEFWDNNVTMYVNGVLEASMTTVNIPNSTVGISPSMKIDSNGGAANPTALIDYIIIDQQSDGDI